MTANRRGAARANDLLSGLTVERAAPRHLQAITDLARAARHDLRAGAKPGSNGFLMAGWQPSEYVAFMEKAEHFLVALQGERLGAFVLTYHSRHEHFEPWLHEQLRQHVDGEYMYYEQICIAPELAHQGVGSMLMTRILDADKNHTVISESARVPLNQASVNFHRKFGFTPLVDLTKPNGFGTSMWILPPQAWPGAKDSTHLA